MLCYLPATHCARYICIKNRPSRGYFAVQWCVHHLFEIGTAIENGLGRTLGPIGRSTRFKPAGQGGLFEWDDPTMPGDFVDQVEARILPMFRSLDALETSIAFVGTYPHKAMDNYAPWRTLMHVALGDIPAAQALWRPIKHRYVEGLMPPASDTPSAFEQMCDLSGPLLAGDRAALVRLLHAWEASNIAGTKLEPYWQPTPFPLERAA